MDKLLKIRDKALKSLAGSKLEGLYLAGGTALSLYYFRHRESFDLDFFTQDFSTPKIEQLMSALQNKLKLKLELAGRQEKQGFAKMLVYTLKAGEGSELKIDFVEDVHKLIEPLRIVDHMPILSIQDIYFRKILAACGSIMSRDQIGRTSFIGGRQEAKDFFDLYFLSNTYTPLSKFVNLYLQQPQKESIIIWFRSYDRFAIKSGLTEIITDKSVPFQEMERHFKGEIEKIISAQL